MLSFVCEELESEVIPLTNCVVEGLNQCDIFTQNDTFFQEWQQVIIEIGNLLEKKYHISAESEIIKSLEDDCELLFELSVRPSRDALKRLLSSLNGFESIIRKNIIEKDVGVSIVAIMKDEGRYLDEFICYHLCVGIEHFFLYDNESTDNTMEVLQPYIDKGYVTYIDCPGERVQQFAYNDALSRFEYETSYMAFIDLDEFIVPVAPIETVPDAVNSIIEAQKQNPYRWKKAGGIGVNWLLYGTSNNVDPVAGLMLESYLYRASEDDIGNCHIKSIVNPRVTKSFPRSSHSVEYISDEYSTISERGSCIYDSPFFFDASFSKLRLHHYISKSETEYLNKLCQRGWPDQTHVQKPKDSPDVISRLNLAKNEYNLVYDDTTLRYVDDIKKRIELIRS